MTMKGIVVLAVTAIVLSAMVKPRPHFVPHPTEQLPVNVP
jgi:hypothetical protein